MSELTNFLTAAQQMAESQSDGATKLKGLIEEKFVVPSLAACKTLPEWIRYRSMFGEIEFRQYLLKLADTKLRSLVKRFDKHAGTTADTSLHEIRSRLEALADKTAEPVAAPTKTKKEKAPAVVVPDLRDIYRQGGNDRVFAVIAALDTKALKAVVESQGLKADIVPRGADGWRKYIQVALKAELGSRGDAIGELSRLDADSESE